MWPQPAPHRLRHLHFSKPRTLSGPLACRSALSLQNCHVWQAKFLVRSDSRRLGSAAERITGRKGAPNARRAAGYALNEFRADAQSTARSKLAILSMATPQFLLATRGLATLGNSRCVSSQHCASRTYYNYPQDFAITKVDAG